LTKRAAWRQRNGAAGRADGGSAYQRYFEPTRAKAFFNGNPIHAYKGAVGVDVYPKHVKRSNRRLRLRLILTAQDVDAVSGRGHGRRQPKIIGDDRQARLPQQCGARPGQATPANQERFIISDQGTRRSGDPVFRSVQNASCLRQARWGKSRTIQRHGPAVGPIQQASDRQRIQIAAHSLAGNSEVPGQLVDAPLATDLKQLQQFEVTLLGQRFVKNIVSTCHTHIGGLDAWKLI
jgi:hypothetical protein